MKRVLAVFFTLALLSVSLFAATAVASPGTGNAAGNGTGTCNYFGNNGNFTNGGMHIGAFYYC